MKFYTFIRHDAAIAEHARNASRVTNICQSRWNAMPVFMTAAATAKSQVDFFVLTKLDSQRPQVLPLPHLPLLLRAEIGEGDRCSHSQAAWMRVPPFDDYQPLCER